MAQKILDSDKITICIKELGAMIRDGLDQLTNAPWLSIFPGLTIFVSVFSFNLIADGLRDISDPKLRG